MSKSDRIVCVEHLTRHFDTYAALDDVSFQVAPGQVYGIVGANGAGKTTLIKHILGLYQAQQGKVRVFGMDPVRHPEAVLARIGYLSEEPDMPLWMRVGELLRYTAAFYPNWDHAYATELMTWFGVDPTLKVRALSKGMRAQVGLCLAQAHRPDLLLLDEPSSGLDPMVRKDILTAIIRTVVDEGRTVIFSSHLLDEVERVSDHLMMLRTGRVLLSEPMEDVLSHHHRLTLRANSAPAFAAELAGILRSAAHGNEWQVDYHGDLTVLQDAATRCGAEILSHRLLCLSDIFQLRSERRHLPEAD